MPYSWVDMILYFFIYSFCGWLMETVLCSIQERSFINRGFLNGPICPIYGCGVSMMLIFLIPVRDTVESLIIDGCVVFMGGVVLASAVEYIASWGMEKLFHARWWDYSHFKHNLNGRICLPISLAWGLLSTVFIYCVQPQFEKVVSWLYTVSSWLPMSIAVGLSGLFFIDVLISIRVATAIGNKLEQMEEWTRLIREHMESLELPTKEEIIHKLEEAYRRATGHIFKSVEENQARMEELNKWHGFSLEKIRSKLREGADEFREKREEIIQGTRLLQRRMLGAFPHMKRTGKPKTPEQDSKDPNPVCEEEEKEKND